MNDAPTSANRPSPLLRTVTGTKTDVWNDSCSPAELDYAIANGAVGATTNPAIVLGVLKKEMPAWRETIARLVADNPAADEDAIAWLLIERTGVKGAELLRPIFEREHGRKGRLSIQTNPILYRNADALVAQAVHFAALAPNIQVKIPVTAAGIPAIEEATRQGVNINATVSFTVPQAIAVAEAIERGLQAPGSRGPRCLGHDPGLHPHGGAARRLAQGSRQTRRHPDHAGPPGLGGRRGDEARVPSLPGPRLPDPFVVRGLSQPSALVGADRRRHRDDHHP